MKPQLSSWRDHWPLFASTVLLWLSILILWLLSLHNNDWRLVYPLDDTYIHMAIAKNAVLHHVWGVTQYGFSWSTSSPLWTAILAFAYWCAGVHIGTPLVLNAILGTAMCAFAYFALRRRSGLSQGQVFVAMLALVFLTSIPSLTLIAMEHVLQLLVVCAFIYMAAASLAAPGAGGSLPVGLILLAPLVSTARYEGLFLIVPAVCLFALRRRFTVAALIFAAAIAPVIGLGLWAMHHGWYFLPSSLMIKGNLPVGLSILGVLQFAARPAINMFVAPWLLVIGGAAAFALYRSLRSSATIWTWPTVALAMYLAMLAADITLSRTGIAWYSRYDAYLVGSGIFIFACCWKEPCFESIVAMFDPRVRSMLARVAMFAIAVAILSRALLTTISIPTGANIIYRQQFQLARLLSDYYDSQSVAINDIGVASYMTHVRITDFFGLATMAVAESMRTNQHNLPVIEQICTAAGVKIAIVYRQVFPHGIPNGWIEIPSAGLLKPLSVGGPEFIFYAAGPEQASLLRARLDEFRHSLPAQLQIPGTEAAPDAQRH